MTRQTAVAACVLALVAALSSSPASASCHVHPRQRVVLYGTGDDPGVFVWDSRFGLRAYHLATFDEAQEMLPRALLVAGGTRAVVLRCIADFVVAPFGLGVEDAFEVKIVTGPQRGRSGWVSGSDVKDI